MRDTVAAMSMPLARTAPRVRGLPVLGPALDLLRDPYRWWARQYQEHGPVFRLRLPGDGPWFVIAGREANELLAHEGHRLFRQDLTYPKAPAILGTKTHPSITEGSLQRHLRRQIGPGFSRQAAGPHLPAMTSWVRKHVDTWSPGQRLRVAEETARLGLNCVSLFASGQELGQDSESLRRYATVFTGILAMNWPMLLLRWPWIRRTRAGLDAMIAERLAEHQRQPPGPTRPPDYFDFLLAGSLPDGSALPDRVRVVFGQIPFKNMGVYAGRVMNHLLVQLVQRPDVLAQVQPEIDRVLADDEITLEEIASMSATKAAIKETLRMLPTAVALQRTVSEPFDFEGYRFEVGDRLFIPISATHFLPEFFPDPDRFDIDRFSPEHDEERPRHVYNPFGLGNHGCLAGGLFEAIAVVTIGTVLHRWKLQADYELKTIVDALPGPWVGHEMTVVERRAAAPPQGKRRHSPTQRYKLSTHLLDAIDGSPEIELEPGQLLFREGDEAERLYFIIDGQLRITRAGPDNEPTEVATVGPGEVVGEIGVLYQRPRNATIHALTRARLLSVDGDLFLQAMAESDLTAREFAELAVRRQANMLISNMLRSGQLPPHLAKRGNVRELVLPAGEILYRRGDLPEDFYLLLEGSVEQLTDDDARVARRISAPDSFGDVGLLDDEPRAATVRTAGAGVRVLVLDREAFASMSKNGECQAELSMLSGVFRMEDVFDPRDLSQG
jgi:cytochrome P450/CRP-like cAMP-binding protein